VEKDSLAECAGIQSDDIVMIFNGKSVNFLGDLLWAIEGQTVTTLAQADVVTAQVGKSVALLVQCDGMKIYVPLRRV
jgi:hypothetical protein